MNEEHENVESKLSKSRGRNSFSLSPRRTGSVSSNLSRTSSQDNSTSKPGVSPFFGAEHLKSLNQENQKKRQ